MKFAILHNETQQRFETTIEDQLCVIDYRLDAKNLSLTSVRVPKPLEGRGIASDLTQTALDWAREKNYHTIPVCPYVQSWLLHHPEYRNILL